MEKENILSAKEKENGERKEKSISRRKIFGQRRRNRTEKKKEGNIRRRRISFYLKEKKNREGKGGKYLGMICPKIVKSIEKSRFRSRSRDFCQFLKGFGIGFGEFGLGKKVSVLISENLVLEKKASVSENKGSGFQAAWPQKLFLIFSDILVDIVDQP